MSQDKILPLHINDENKERLIKDILKTDFFLLAYEDNEVDGTSFLFTEGATLSMLTFYEKALSNYVTQQMLKD